MQSVQQIRRLNDAELEKCVPPSASWHTDYRDTAYIHVGGLPFELSEGDVLTIFSQYGNPVHVNLVRDKETGKSRGFAFLKYEDQRSCDLAVDNLSGAGVLGRVLTVDHARYKAKDGEIEGEGMEDEADDTEEDATDTEGDSRRKRPRTNSVEEGERRPRLKEEIELAKLLQDHDNDDPMKAYLIQEKKDQVAEALQALSMQSHDKHGHKERIHRRRKERDRSRSDGGSRDRDRDRDRERERRRRRDTGDNRERVADSGHQRSTRDADRDVRRRSLSRSEEREHRHQRDWKGRRGSPFEKLKSRRERRHS